MQDNRWPKMPITKTENFTIRIGGSKKHPYTWSWVKLMHDFLTKNVKLETKPAMPLNMMQAPRPWNS